MLHEPGTAQNNLFCAVFVSVGVSACTSRILALCLCRNPIRYRNSFDGRRRIRHVKSGAGGSGGHGGDACGLLYAKIANADLVGSHGHTRPGSGDESLAGKKPFHSVYADFDTMLTETHPDVVDVCCPDALACGLCVQSGGDGRDEWGLRGISTEKPMASERAEECRRMIAACELADVPLFVAHVLRFFPEYALAKQGVEGGYVGKPAAIRTRRGGSMPRAWNDWYANFDWSGRLHPRPDYP